VSEAKRRNLEERVQEQQEQFQRAMAFQREEFQRALAAASQVNADRDARIAELERALSFADNGHSVNHGRAVSSTAPAPVPEANRETDVDDTEDAAKAAQLQAELLAVQAQLSNAKDSAVAIEARLQDLLEARTNGAERRVSGTTGGQANGCLHSPQLGPHREARVTMPGITGRAASGSPRSSARGPNVIRLSSAPTPLQLSHVTNQVGHLFGCGGAVPVPVVTVRVATDQTCPVRLRPDQVPGAVVATTNGERPAPLFTPHIRGAPSGADSAASTVAALNAYQQTSEGCSRSAWAAKATAVAMGSNPAPSGMDVSSIGAHTLARSVTAPQNIGGDPGALPASFPASPSPSPAAVGVAMVATSARSCGSGCCGPYPGVCVPVLRQRSAALPGEVNNGLLDMWSPAPPGAVPRIAPPCGHRVASPCGHSDGVHRQGSRGPVDHVSRWTSGHQVALGSPIGSPPVSVVVATASDRLGNAIINSNVHRQASALLPSEMTSREYGVMACGSAQRGPSAPPDPTRVRQGKADGSPAKVAVAAAPGSAVPWRYVAPGGSASVELAHPVSPAGVVGGSRSVATACSTRRQAPQVSWAPHAPQSVPVADRRPGRPSVVANASVPASSKLVPRVSIASPIMGNPIGTAQMEAQRPRNVAMGGYACCGGVGSSALAPVTYATPVPQMGIWPH